MKRLLLILSLAFIAISCEEDQIIPAIEGPALTLNVAPAAYTDAEGTGADIQIANTMEIGLYEFDKSASLKIPPAISSIYTIGSGCLLMRNVYWLSPS